VFSATWLKLTNKFMTQKLPKKATLVVNNSGKSSPSFLDTPGLCCVRAPDFRSLSFVAPSSSMQSECNDRAQLIKSRGPQVSKVLSRLKHEDDEQMQPIVVLNLTQFRTNVNSGKVCRKKRWAGWFQMIGN
jgi:hypothetical protein